MIVEDTTFDIGATGDVASVDYDYGFDAGGFVGYDFGPVRIEAEARYAEANIDQVTVGNTGFLASNIRAGSGVYPASGQIDSLAFMVNGLADFGPDDGLQGFVGGGVGVARTGLEARITRSGPAGIDDSDTDFAWQILAGVRAPLTDNIDVGLKYRLFPRRLPRRRRLRLVNRVRTSSSSTGTSRTSLRKQRPFWTTRFRPTPIAAWLRSCSPATPTPRDRHSTTSACPSVVTLRSAIT